MSQQRSRLVVWLCVGLTALGYALVYLYAIGDLTPRAATDTGLRLMNEPQALMWQRRFGVQFEGVAIVRLPGLIWLASPINAVIALGLGGLVGTNALLGYRAYRRRQCRIGGAAASLSTAPALLSGVACCAPATFLALGLPVTASVIALFQWLVPLAAALMVASAVWLQRQAR